MLGNQKAYIQGRKSAGIKELQDKKVKRDLIKNLNRNTKKG